MRIFLKKQLDDLKKHAELKKIIVNMNWLFLERVIQMAISFLVGVLVIRYLGPEKYGLLSYAVALISFFIVFSQLGLGSITIREFVKGDIQEEKLFGTVFYLKLAGGVLAMILAIITAYFLKSDLLIIFIVAIIAFTLVFQSADVIDYWFQSQVASKYIAYSRSIACIMIAIIKIWLISVNASLVWFAIVISLEAIFIMVGFTIAYRKNKKGIGQWVFDNQVAWRLLKYSWPLIFLIVSTNIYMRIDQIMIGNMLSYAELGNYSVAVNLGEMWYFIPAIITASVFPAIIITKKRNNKIYNERLQNLYDFIVWIAILAALSVTFFSDEIVQFLYGIQYMQAASVLVIYVWAGIFISLNTASIKWYIAEDLQYFASFFAVIGAVINIGLNYILIQKMGINGAAWATLLSYALSIYILPSIFPLTRGDFIRMSKSLFLLQSIKNIINIGK